MAVVRKEYLHDHVVLIGVAFDESSSDLAYFHESDLDPWPPAEAKAYP